MNKSDKTTYTINRSNQPNEQPEFAHSPFNWTIIITDPTMSSGSFPIHLTFCRWSIQTASSIITINTRLVFKIRKNTHHKATPKKMPSEWMMKRMIIWKNVWNSVTSWYMASIGTLWTFRTMWGTILLRKEGGTLKFREAKFTLNLICSTIKRQVAEDTMICPSTVLRKVEPLVSKTMSAETKWWTIIYSNLSKNPPFNSQVPPNTKDLPARFRGIRNNRTISKIPTKKLNARIWTTSKVLI